MSRKRVLLRVSFTLEKEVPEDWDKAMILFHYNESSSCAANLLEDKLRENEGCCCMTTETVVVEPDA